jgi:hypothetical protein
MAHLGDNVVVCPSCKKGIPCGSVTKKTPKDILSRIVRFQNALRKLKSKESLPDLVDEVTIEIIRLRKEEERLRGYDGPAQPRYLPPGYKPPRHNVCPHCSKRIPCSVAGRKNRIDILERVSELKKRLKESRAMEPLYFILGDALMEIRKLRSRIETLKGRK